MWSSTTIRVDSLQMMPCGSSPSTLKRQQVWSSGTEKARWLSRETPLGTSRKKTIELMMEPDLLIADAIIPPRGTDQQHIHKEGWNNGSLFWMQNRPFLLTWAIIFPLTMKPLRMALGYDGTGILNYEFWQRNKLLPENFYSVFLFNFFNLFMGGLSTYPGTIWSLFLFRGLRTRFYRIILSEFFDSFSILMFRI